MNNGAVVVGYCVLLVLLIMITLLAVANIILLIIFIITDWRKSVHYKKSTESYNDILAENSLKNAEALKTVVDQTVALKKQNKLLIDAIEKGLYVTNNKNSAPLD